MKSVRIRNFSGLYFPAFGRNTGKYRPEKLYTDTFYAAITFDGFALGKTNASKSNLAEAKSWNQRITIAKFTENPESTFAIRFSSAEDDDQAEEHYKQLTDRVKSIPEHNRGG